MNTENNGIIIYEDAELSNIATNKKFLLVQKEGTREVKRRNRNY